MFLIIFLTTMAIGLLAQWHVRRTYARHNQTPTQSGYTGAQAAQQLLQEAEIEGA
jgi:Zn-dependent membrane protease YugP